jgi:hypothetical protein
MCLWWAGFLIYTVPMRGACFTSVVHALSGCQAFISFMLPVVLFCYRVCLFGMVPRWVQVHI